MRFLPTFFVLFLLSLPANAAEPIQHIYTTHEPPTNFIDGKELSGTTTELVRAILWELNQFTDIQVLPWSRAMKHIARTPNTAIFTAGKTPEREIQGYQFVGPVASRTHALIALSNTPITLSSLSDITAKNLRVGGLRDDWRSLYLQSQGIEVNLLNNPNHGFQQLLNHRIDLWAASDLEALHMAHEQGVDFKRLRIAYKIKVAPSYIMFSKDTGSDTIQAWQEAIQTLSDKGFFTQQIKYWKQRLNIDLTYQPDKGYYIADK